MKDFIGLKTMVNNTTGKTERLKIGEGIISGYASIFLGLISILSILCFQFPDKFTTPEFRVLYDMEILRKILMGVIIGSLLFTATNFLLSERKKAGVIGLILSTIAIALGGFHPEIGGAHNNGWSIGLDWLVIDILLLSIIFIPIEMVFPKNKEQPRFHAEWRTDMIYFAISHLLVQIFGVITRAPATILFGQLELSPMQEWIQNLPFLAAFLLALFTTDFFQYWGHRFFHSHPFLWRFHSVHHSTKAMDWLAGSRTHLVDALVVRALSFMPLFILGFTPLVFNTYIIFISILATLIHTNTRINFGFFKYIFATPQFHHWHHGDEPAYYGKNFAVVFPFIDMIFGTYHLPKDVWPRATGVSEANYPKGYWRQLIYPFQKNPFNADPDLRDKSER